MIVNLKNASSKVMLTDYLSQYYKTAENKFVFKQFIATYNLIFFNMQNKFTIIKDNFCVPLPEGKTIGVYHYKTYDMHEPDNRIIELKKHEDDYYMTIEMNCNSISLMLNRYKNFFFENPTAPWRKLVFKKNIKSILSGKYIAVSPSEVIEKLFENATHLPGKKYNIVQRIWCQKKFLEYSSKGSNQKEYIEV